MSANGSSSGRWDVYLSYARPTRSLARAICKFLRAAGLRVWFDEDCVPARQGWLDASGQAIARSRYQIILLAEQSPALWQRAEMNFADRSAVRYPHLETIPLIRPGYDESEFGAWLSRFEPARLPVDKTKIDHSLRELMARLKGTRRSPWRAGEDLGNPYPGLAPYGLNGGRTFFGRDLDLAEALRRFGDQPEGEARRWLHIDGPAGIGKTSFARAGVVPAVLRGALTGAPGDWHIAAFRPAANPVGSLSAALIGAFGQSVPTSDVERALQTSGGLSDLVREHLPADHGLLLVLDHLEDVVTEAGDAPENVALFDGLMAEALDDFDQRMFLVTTGRHDLANRVAAALPKMAGLASTKSSVVELGGLSRDALNDVVSCPIALVGRSWPDGLANNIVDEAERVPGCTGRLSWLLAGLFDTDAVSVESANALGGVADGLSNTLDALLDDLGGEDLDRARNLMIALVGAGRGQTDHPISLSSSDALEAAGSGPRARALLTRLAAGTGPGPKSPLIQLIGESQVRLAHGLLLRDWPRLREWVAGERSVLERRADVETAARAWKAAGADDNALPRGDQLGLYAGADFIPPLRSRLRATMSTPTRHYVEAAEARATKIENDKSAAISADKKAATQAVEDERKKLNGRIRLTRWIAALLLVGLVAVAAVAANIWIQISDLQEQVSVADKSRRAAAKKVVAAERLEHQADARKVAAEIELRQAVQGRRLAEQSEKLAQKQADEVTHFSTLVAADADALFDRIPGADGSYVRRAFGKSLVARLKEALKKSPDNTRLAFLLGRAQLLRGQLSADGAALSAARPALERAVGTFEKLLAGNDAPPIEHLEALNEAYGSLAGFLANPRRPQYADLPKATEVQAKAVTIAERMLKQAPDDPKTQAAVARAYARSGAVHLAGENYDEAVAATERAIKIIEPLAKASPDNIEFGLQHVSHLEDRGDIEMARRAWTDAVTAYQNAVSTLEPYTQRAPSNDRIDSARTRVRRKFSVARSSVPR